MYPFIWWLSEQFQPAVAVDGGGADFMRRRVIMETGAHTKWTPQLLPLSAWYYARRDYVDLDGGGLVTTWYDRSPYGMTLTAALDVERPTWEESGGWSASKSSILFPGAKNLGTSAAAISTMFNGADVPFWVLCTCELTDLTQDRTILSWDGATSNSQCYFTDTTGFSSYVRTDDVSSTVDAESTVALTANTHRRLAWYFSGTTVSSYIDLAPALVNVACDVGACTFTRLRIGEAIGPADTLIGRIAELIIGTGPISLATVAPRYYSYSRAEWGP